MKKIELTLETVTPMFLGGADQQPELRPASVRGALRYWLRAALGGVIGDGDLKRLAKLEASVFGETDRGSAITVRLSQPHFTASQEFLLPHKSGTRAGPTNAVPQGLTFVLTLMLRPRNEVSVLQMATWGALLWLTLGAIGRRSRRGAGSLRITAWSSEPMNLLPQDLSDCLAVATTTPADKQALSVRIADILDMARTAFNKFGGSTSPHFSSGGAPTFSILREDTRIVVWAPSGHDYNSAVSPLMNLLSTQMAANPDAFRDGFGGVQPSRRASPLLVNAHQLNGELALVLTHLVSKIRVDRRGNSTEGRPDEVIRFLDNLPQTVTVEAYPRRQRET